MEEKAKEKRVSVEVELPEWMAHEADARGVNLDDVLEKALKEKLKRKKSDTKGEEK